MENNFNQLLEATMNHLKDKKYLYKPIIPLKKNGKIVTDKNRQPVIKRTDPTPHKNVMLSIAMNVARENYRCIRRSEKYEVLKPNEISDLMLRYFSNKFVDKIGETQLIDLNQNYRYDAIERFRNIEYKLFAVVSRLRNYHSHYVHEPGILSFEDLFKNEKDLTAADINEAREWFENKFDLAKEHLKLSLAKRKEILLDKSGKSEKELKELDYKLQDAATKKLIDSIKEINHTIEQFNNLFLIDENTKSITLNGQLFIACIFMYKQQVKTVLEKWRDLRLEKNIKGYGNSLHTFFTYYCLSERYSLNNFNDNLLKFRDITSKLTTIPNSSNEQLEPIYNKIREINKINYENIELAAAYNALNTKPYSENKLRKIGKRINEIIDSTNSCNNLKNLNYDGRIKEFCLTDFQSRIMPIRRRNVLTRVLLQYLLDNDLFDENLSIAIAKTGSDRIKYFEENMADGIVEQESLEQLKDKIKVLPDSDPLKKILKEHYKELKRNFMFKSAAELKELASPQVYEIKKDESDEINDDTLTETDTVTEIKGYRFAENEKNALFQYRHSHDGTITTINVVMSPQLLLKWAFVHLCTGTNNGWESIKKHLDDQASKLTKGLDSKTFIQSYLLDSKHIDYADELTGDFVKKYNKDGHNLNKIFPRSIMQSAGLRQRYADVEAAINERIERLEKFEHNNRIQPKPWVYESKKKMDLIFEYLHFKLLEDVYINGINKDEDAETFIRHTFFSINSYDIIRQYFRFFGRYEKKTYDKLNIYGTEKFAEPPLIEKAKKKYQLVFSYISAFIEKNKSLEDLFQAVIIRYTDELKKMGGTSAGNNKQALIRVLKIDTGSDSANVDSLLSTHYLKNIALSDEIISVKDECKVLLREIIDEKSNNGKPQNYTDYSFMRTFLEKLDGVKTNTDFILQHIVPQLTFENMPEGKAIPNAVFRKLMKIKTEELVLWNIAKTYWKKANGAPYKTELPTGDSDAYQVCNTFNKAYKQELNYTIQIEPKFWDKEENKPDNKKKFKKVIAKNPEITSKTLEIKLKVPARSYDGQFLAVETEMITEYCLWNHCKNNEIVLPAEHIYYNGNNEKKTLNLQVFDELMKMIRIELRKSLAYIGALLVAEKKLSEKYEPEILLRGKYEGKKTINDFYLKLKDIAKFNGYNKSIFDSFISFIGGINGGNMNKQDIIEYLVPFRNFAMHYQLQDPGRSREVEKLLKAINKSITEVDYDVTE